MKPKSGEEEEEGASRYPSCNELPKRNEMTLRGRRLRFATRGLNMCLRVSKWAL